jgi:hypothetical protein
MKGIHTILILFQLLAAFLQRDKNRVAYLMYLWSTNFEHSTTTGGGVSHTSSTTMSRETKPDEVNREYPLLLER